MNATSEQKAHLCKCNNCGTVMIDQNPQVGAKLHKLTGQEVEMQYIKGLVESNNVDEEFFWACPVCLTDGYLTDM